jgi:hypothetical protein
MIADAVKMWCSLYAVDAVARELVRLLVARGVLRVF